MQDNPSPVNPAIHVQVKEPIVFWQTALGSQGEERHSLISNKYKHYDYKKRRKKNDQTSLSVLLIIFRKTTISEKKKVFLWLLKEKEWKCHVGRGPRGWGVRGSKPPRLAGGGLDITYSGQRSPPPPPPPTIPASVIWTSGCKNISWYVICKDMLCLLWEGEIFSSPHLWLEQVLSLALQVKNMHSKIHGQFSNCDRNNGILLCSTSNRILTLVPNNKKKCSR